MPVHRSPRWVALLLLLAALPPSLFAKLERGSWREVEGLAKGVTIKVSLAGDKVLTGSFSGVSGNSLQLVDKSGERSIARSEVIRVEVKGEANRARNGLIGAAIGLGLGVLADATLGARSRNETGEGAAMRAATYAIPMAAGGGLGALFANSYRTVYLAAKSRN
ncbi:MAG: hypothetical protein NTX13_16215 [Acidobacteria bacterium]|nr:hypothetical protein [Acidobacteriota bacterium]